MSILITILITALVANGLHFAGGAGQLLEPLMNKVAKLPRYIRKPLMTCPMCMAGSVWNVITVLLYYWATGNTIDWQIVPHIALNGLGATYMAALVFDLLTYLAEMPYQKTQSNPCTGECIEQ